MRVPPTSPARRIVPALVVLGVALAGADAGTGAAEPGVLELLAQVGGGATAVQVDGDYAYVGAGARLVIADVSQPGAMVVVGETVPLAQPIAELVVQNGLAYLAANAEGLRIVNVAEPTAPVEVGHISTFDADGGIAVSGGHVFACSGGTVQIVDVSNPAAPTVAAVFTAAQRSVWDVAVAGNIAYVAEWGVPSPSGALELVDISDPTHPAQLGVLPLDHEAFVVAVGEGFCLLSGNTGTVSVVGVAAPSQPHLLGQVDVPSAYNATSLVLQGETAFVGFLNRGVALIDVSEPAKPQYRTTVLSHGWPSMDAAVEGNLVFIANDYHLFAGAGPGFDFQQSQGYWALEAFDFSDFDPPRWLGGLPSLWYGLSAGVADDTVFVAAGGAGMRSLDVTDPSQPLELAPQVAIGNFTDVAIARGHAFVTSAWVGRLLVFDVSDARNPSLVDENAFPGRTPVSVAVDGHYVFMVMEETTEALHVFDISDPASPESVGSLTYDSPSRPQVTARDGFVYVVGQTPGNSGRLDVIDARNPTAPTRIAFLRFDESVFGVAVDGAYAYVAAGTAGLRVVDVRDPAVPKLVGASNLGWPATGITFRWPYAFVSGGGGVAVIDVADPENPRLLDSLDHASGPFGDRPTRPLLVGDTLYVPDMDQGLLVVGVNLSGVPTHPPTPTRTPTPTSTPTSTSTPPPTSTHTPPPTDSPTPSATGTASPTETDTPTLAPSPTDTAQSTSTATATAVPTATDVRTVTATPTTTVTPSAVPAVTASATPTDAPTATTVPATGTPAPLYMPVALRESCPPKDLYLDVVLVIDASTSMYDLTTVGRPKIDVAKESTALFLAALRLGSGPDRAAIVAFNQTAQTLQGLTSDRAALDTALGRIRLVEQSRVDRGIERAMVELITQGRPGHVLAMVVLSDGRANPVSGDQAVAAARRAQLEDITVYVVGLGPSMDERVLRQMASGAERYFAAPDPDLIRDIYLDLTRRVPCPPEAYWGRR